MGWNNLSIYKNNNLLNGITDNDQFYFVHSFFWYKKQEKYYLSYQVWNRYICIVHNDNILVLPHPEKVVLRLRILCNWLKLVNERFWIKTTKT